jgi:hypothetical protein
MVEDVKSVCAELQLMRFCAGNPDIALQRHRIILAAGVVEGVASEVAVGADAENVRRDIAELTRGAGNSRVPVDQRAVGINLAYTRDTGRAAEARRAVVDGAFGFERLGRSLASLKSPF